MQRFTSYRGNKKKQKIATLPKTILPQTSIMGADKFLSCTRAAGKRFHSVITRTEKKRARKSG